MEEHNPEEAVTTPIAKKPNRALLFILLFVIVLILGPKFIRTKDTTVPPTAAPAIKETPITLVDVNSGMVTVEAGSFYYKPNMIRIQKGQKIKLTLSSIDTMHDFNIDELKIKVPLTRSGSTSTVEFSVDRAGEYEFYCSVGQHRQMGQVGKLIVIE